MRNLILFFFLFIYLSVSSQELLIYQDQKKESYLLKYTSSNDPSQQVINSMINRFASAQNKSYSAFQFSFSHNQHISISRKNVSVLIYVDFSNFILSPAALYKTFDISGFWLPYKISFKGRLIDNSNQVLSEYSINPVSIDLENSNFSFSFTDSNANKDFKFQITEKKFYYDQNSLDHLDQRLQDIDHYYLAGNKIIQIANDLRHIDVMNPDLLENNFRLLADIENFVSETNDLNLPQKLSLNQNDPQKLLSQMDMLSSLINEVKNALLHTQDFRHEIYFNRGINELNNQRFDIARDMFRKSIQANPHYAPALLYLAKLDLRDGQFALAAEKIVEILTQMNPDPLTQKESFEVAVAINEIYASEADRFYQGKRYYEVIQMFEEGVRFCSSIPNFPCKEELYTLKTNARKSIYTDYIQKGEVELKAGKFREAEDFAALALKYQSDFITDIPDNKEAQAFLLRIKQSRYNVAIKDGEAFLTKKQYRQALDQFLMAEELEKSYPLSKQTKLMDLIKKALKPVLLEDMVSGKNLISQNKIEQARDIVFKVMELTEKYSLKNDKEIAVQLDDLQKRIITQECINAGEELKKFMEKAENNVKDLDFITAEKNWIKVIELVNSNPLCRLDKNTATQKIEIYKDPISYQKQLEDIFYQISKSNYKVAVNNYINTENFFFQNKLDQFGLKHSLLYNFISTNESGLIIYGITYYMDINEPDNAMNLMHILKLRNYSSKYLKNEQLRLADKLALRDAKNDINSNPKLLLAGYTNADKWFKIFNKAYLKKWKTLN